MRDPVLTIPDDKRTKKNLYVTDLTKSIYQYVMITNWKSHMYTMFIISFLDETNFEICAPFSWVQIYFSQGKRIIFFLDEILFLFSFIFFCNCSEEIKKERRKTCHYCQIMNSLTTKILFIFLYTEIHSYLLIRSKLTHKTNQ